MWLAHSPDGRFLATGSQDRTVKVWDAKTGDLRHTLPGHSFWICDLAFSPDGRFLATAAWTDPHVGLWMSSREHSAGVVRASGGRVAVRFTPDGRELATSGLDRRIRIWEVGSGRLAREWRVKGNAIPMDFSPDGQRLVAWVSASYTAAQDVPSLQLWDPHQGRLLLTLQGHTDVGFLVAFHQSGRRILSSSTDQSARQWEAFPGASRSIRRLVRNRWPTGSGVTPPVTGGSGWKLRHEPINLTEQPTGSCSYRLTGPACPGAIRPCPGTCST